MLVLLALDKAFNFRLLTLFRIFVVVSVFFIIHNGTTQHVHGESMNTGDIVTEEIRHCFDYRDTCRLWAESGKCTETDHKWVHSHCPVSCKTCDKVIQQKPAQESFNIYQHRVVDEIKNAIGADLGLPQLIPDNDEDATQYMEQMTEILDSSRTYLKEEIYSDEKYSIVRQKCRLGNSSCSQLAMEGLCDDDPDFMIEEVGCALICRSCDQLHLSTRCPLPHPNDVKNAWRPNDLNRMFERIVGDSTLARKYNITVLSRPLQISENQTMPGADVDEIDRPWVVLIDNFLDEAEANRLINLGQNAGYTRSMDVGEVLENGMLDSVVSTDRTSTNAWCDTDECTSDPIANDIYKRMESLTGIPAVNYESFQLLRYEAGQFYKEHHDYIDEEYDHVNGVRILTIYLYLNDVVEENGGGTNFPELDLTVQPKLGRALIWPSVLNDQPHYKDDRTTHQALPVLGANEIKYGANVWMHQREIIDECL